MIRTLIVDDEPHARRKINRFLERHDDVKVVGEARNGTEGISLMRNLKPDLVFLDIKMPDFDGFEVLTKKEKECRPFIIFSTAFSKYAIRAFEVDTVDYILKPYDQDRFDRSLIKARDYLMLRKSAEINLNIRELLEGNKSAENDYLKELVITDKGREIKVQLTNIEFFKAYGNYVQINLPDNRLVYRQTMSKLLNQLDPDDFMRVHRSFVINKGHIDRVRYLNKNEYEIVMKSGYRLSSGRKHAGVIRSFLSVEI